MSGRGGCALLTPAPPRARAWFDQRARPMAPRAPRRPYFHGALLGHIRVIGSVPGTWAPSDPRLRALSPYARILAGRARRLAHRAYGAYVTPLLEHCASALSDGVPCEPAPCTRARLEQHYPFEQFAKLYFVVRARSWNLVRAPPEPAPRPSDAARSARAARHAACVHASADVRRRSGRRLHGPQAGHAQPRPGRRRARTHNHPRPPPALRPPGAHATLPPPCIVAPITSAFFVQVGIRVQFNKSAHAFVATATAPVGEGRELLFYYGRNCRERAVDLYGFAANDSEPCRGAQPRWAAQRGAAAGLRRPHQSHIRVGRTPSR